MSTEVERATPADAGCWVSSGQGWRGGAIVVEIAHGRGMPHDADDIAILAAYVLGDEATPVTLTDGTVITGENAADYVIGQGEMADTAVEWLNDNVAPEGYVFEWCDGDFMLWSDAASCEASGDWCQCDEPHADGKPLPDVGTVLTNYLMAALWSSCDSGDGESDNPEPLDATYDVGDIAPESVTEARTYVTDFLRLCQEQRPDVFKGMDPGQIGHDFWLTRNGHGAGFWDRGLGELGDWLTEQAKTFGEVDPHVGDDGKVWIQE